MLDQTEAAARKALAKGAISEELFGKLTDKWIAPEEKAESSAQIGNAEGELAALTHLVEPLLREFLAARKDLELHPTSKVAGLRLSAAREALEAFDQKSTNPAAEKLLLRRDLYVAVCEQAKAQRDEPRFPEPSKAAPAPPEVPLGAFHVLLKWLMP